MAYSYTRGRFLANGRKSDKVRNIWRGIAFEELCLNNIRSIKKALEIGGVSSNESSLNIKGEDSAEGSQIDLIIDRADNVVNLCEMKFYNDEL